MNQSARLLVVDDEPEILDILSEYFQSKGYGVKTAESAAQARQLIEQHTPELMIVDIQMPGEDGLSLTRWVREQYPEVRVVMLTTASEVIDRVVGLEMGADDYIAKPFDLREVLARVKVLLRRMETVATVASSPGRIHFGSNELDVNRRKLFDANNREISLTAMEFDLLKAFAEHPNRVFNRDQLMELAHHKGWEAFDRSIDLRIMRLRRKIEVQPDKPEIIKTVRGVGYMYVTDS